jgi:hypothetical protein
MPVLKIFKEKLGALPKDRCSIAPARRGMGG